MKHVVVTALFSILSVWAAGAETFQIISLEHRIRAESDGQVFLDHTSGNPLSFNWQDGGLKMGASTDLAVQSGFYVFQTGADLNATELDWPTSRTWQVSASISMLIQPLGDECEIHSILYDEWWGSRSYAEITNITTGQRLYYSDFFGGDPDGIYPLAVQDQYLISLYSGVSFGEEYYDYRFTVGTLYFSVAATPVIPEPASLLLSAIGLAMCLLGRRRAARQI